MKTIYFTTQYYTTSGQSLYVHIIPRSTAEADKGDVEEQRIRLNYTTCGHWSISVQFDTDTLSLEYYYLVGNDMAQTLRQESGGYRCLELDGTNPDTIYCVDQWQADELDDVSVNIVNFYDALNIQPIEKQDGNKFYSTIISVYAPHIPTGKKLYLSGEESILGSWQVEAAIRLYYTGQGFWSTGLNITLDNIQKPLCFKYFIADEHRQGIIWEEGDNRTYVPPPILSKTAQQNHNSRFQYRLSTSGVRVKLCLPRFAGVAVPLFSLRSYQDFGIGDMGVLKKAIDWARESSLHILQLLPINDTTFYRDWRDSYPYNAISTDAIHPIYIDISALKPLKNNQEQEEFLQAAKQLRCSSELIYPEVLALKERYLRQHYVDYASVTSKHNDYKIFVRNNETWLLPYSIYCVLRDRHPRQTFSTWGKYSQYNKDIVNEFRNKPSLSKEINYYYYIQYLLHRQLYDLSVYAQQQGVILKGDLPIGVAPHSVEVWTQGELFFTDRSAGAPPDNFAIDGQNWGFPTYNWERMKQDGFIWWRQRFTRLSQYFKAIRIDHILGFFRIWEIPQHQESGLLGHFTPALPEPLDYWLEKLAYPYEGELLTQPVITIAQAIQDLGEYLPKLIAQGLLIPTQENKYLLLPHGRQRDWRKLDPNQVVGGEQSIALLVNYCKETALVADCTNPNVYHPRIAFEQSNLFASWSTVLQNKWLQLSSDYYYHKHNDLWERTAIERLSPLCQHSNILICAEDLGMIPASVPEVLTRLGILSLELERMPKQVTSTGLTQLETLTYQCVCTSSTHDMPPLRAWWESLHTYQQADYLCAQLPENRLNANNNKADIYTKIITRHLSSPAMLTILPIQDWTSIDSTLHLQEAEEEQINYPEKPQHRWSYRLAYNIEDLLTPETDITKRIKTILQTLNRE